MNQEVAKSDLPQNGVISLESFCDLLDESEVKVTMDMGNTLLHKVVHPILGSILLISSTACNAMMTL